MTELMRDSLVLARNLGMDVFNALNLMQNQEFLQVSQILYNTLVAHSLHNGTSLFHSFTHSLWSS